MSECWGLTSSKHLPEPFAHPVLPGSESHCDHRQTKHHLRMSVRCRLPRSHSPGPLWKIPAGSGLGEEKEEETGKSQGCHPTLRCHLESPEVCSQPVRERQAPYKLTRSWNLMNKVHDEPKGNRPGHRNRLTAVSGEGVRGWMMKGEGTAREHICMTHGRRQQCGDGLREGGWGLRGGG